MTESGEPSFEWKDALVRRPAMSAAALLIAGIVAHELLPAWGFAYLLLAIAALSICAMTFKRPAINTAALAFAIFFTGTAAAQLEAFYFHDSDIAAYATDQPRLARVELQFDEPLRILANAYTPGRQLPPRQVTTATVTQVFTKTGWKPTSGKALIQIDPPNYDLHLGQRVQVLGMLQRPSPAMNPGQFNWAEYYRDQRILTSLQLSHGGALKIVGSTSPSPLARLREFVRASLARGFAPNQSLEHALLRALVLGDNDPELRDVQEQFRRTGTSHHLAISGMHVAVLGMLIYYLLHRLRLHPRRTTQIAVVCVFLYGLVALPSPPVWRSVILCTAVAIGLLKNRAIDFIQLLAVSIIILLVMHPLDLYNAGFQLSFGTVLGLMVMTKSLLQSMRDRDAEVVMHTPGGRPPWGIRFSYWARKKCGPPLATGMIAWIISMPLIAYHFDQLNPWAVIASILLAVPVFCSLIAGFFKIALTILLPFGASWWATLATIPVAWMRHCVDWLSRVPGSDLPLPAHSILFVVIYYGLILLPLIPVVRPKIRLTFKLAPALAVMLLIVIPFAGGAAAIPKGSLSVTALAVGAGQCCVIELPDGRLILLDAGSNSLTDPVRRCIAPYLRSKGRSSIDEIWLADCDYDHIAAVAELIRIYHVGRIVYSNRFEHDAAGKPADEALLDLIRERNIPVTRLTRGDQIQLGKATISVLWPPPTGSFGASNNHDLVLKLTYARRTILFPADIQQPAQSALLKDASQLRCDAMLAPHHGSGESTTPAFIAAADPLYIVSSNDRTPTQKQLLFKRQLKDRPLFSTDKSGATTITIDRAGGLTVSPFVPSISDD